MSNFNNTRFINLPLVWWLAAEINGKRSINQLIFKYHYLSSWFMDHTQNWAFEILILSIENPNHFVIALQQTPGRIRPGSDLYLLSRSV